MKLSPILLVIITGLITLIWFSNLIFLPKQTPINHTIGPILFFLCNLYLLWLAKSKAKKSRILILIGHVISYIEIGLTLFIILTYLSMLFWLAPYNSRPWELSFPLLVLVLIEVLTIQTFRQIKNRGIH